MNSLAEAKIKTIASSWVMIMNFRPHKSIVQKSLLGFLKAFWGRKFEAFVWDALFRNTFENDFVLSFYIFES